MNGVKQKQRLLLDGFNGEASLGFLGACEYFVYFLIISALHERFGNCIFIPPWERQNFFHIGCLMSSVTTFRPFPCTKPTLDIRTEKSVPIL
jgi:hypothetical protein